jgi:ubiquinone/menaquinone biosynthesis C-methylase UbiE
LAWTLEPELQGHGMTGTRHFEDGKTERICALIAAIHPRIKRLLVVGCGYGIEAAILAEVLGATVIGIDTQDRFDADARRVADLRIGDALALDFPDESFDFVYSYHTLEHIGQPAVAIREMARVLKRDGGYWIGTPNRSRLFGYIGSHGVTFSEKVRWNMNDWRARLSGRFRNELGAHAGFTLAELRGLIAASLPPPKNQTFAYYRAMYPARPTALNVLNATALYRIAYPCVYFSGKGV